MARGGLITGGLRQTQGFFQEQAQRQQARQLQQLQARNIESQIGLREAQAQQALTPKTESGSSLLARLKEEAGRLLLDPNTPPEIRQRIQRSGIFGGVNVTQTQGDLPQLAAKEDARIAESFQAEADRKNAENPDSDTRTVVKTSTRTGRRFLTTEPKPLASAGERIDIADALASEDALNNLGDLFNESFVGPIAGRVNQVKQLFVGNPEKLSDFLAASAAMKNAVIKQITGAQMSEPEARRIVKQIPLPEDPPSTWKSKRRQSLKNIAFMKKRRTQIIRESGLRVIGRGGEDTLSSTEQAELDFINKEIEKLKAQGR